MGKVEYTDIFPKIGLPGNHFVGFIQSQHLTL